MPFVGRGGGAWIFSGTTPCSIDNDCNKMSSAFILKLISSVGANSEEHLIERKFAFSDPSSVDTTRYNLFYKGTTFENSFGKYGETLKILSTMASIQRIEEHLTSLGKNGAYNEYAAASMKMTRNNVDKITMF